MQKIVITDGYTLNPGDLSWEEFKSFGEIILRDRTSASEVEEVCKDATVIVTNKTSINRPTIQNASQLKLIAVTATGYNIVNTVAAKEYNVPVCNVPGYGTDSVAQHTFALILELTNHVGLNARSVAEGEWGKSKDFCYSKKSIVELSGKTLGIIGLGKIGEKVAEIGSAFGMNIIYHNRSVKQATGKQVSIEEVFANADVVTLHCPLTSENQGFVNKKLLSIMKPSAILINTARGQLINESDLANALNNGTLAGAGLDVLSQEPPPADHPLIGIANCIITPHNAWLSFEARQRIMRTTLENVRLALDGKPQNVVN